MLLSVVPISMHNCLDNFNVDACNTSCELYTFLLVSMLRNLCYDESLCCDEKYM